MTAEDFTEAGYAGMIEKLFSRFPSFQKVGAGAYKPGIDNMIFFDSLAGHPHRKYAAVHVAGTNGKGSVSCMTASALSRAGLKTGLYTSPHILDFRERMRVLEGHAPATYISKEEVWTFVHKWSGTFEHLGLSFFEITTMMAFDWFAKQKVDVAVIETGLGGRLDSTNIITPALSIITNIGLDHCDMLGNTLPEIAFEKAGIIKPSVPAVIGESDERTDEIFERKVLYSNLPDPQFMGDRKHIMSLLTFADKSVPYFWDRKDEILGSMDLQGEYQEKNLRTALTALDVLASDAVTDRHPVFSAVKAFYGSAENGERLLDALENTAAAADFHGRWEKLSENPPVIADIGHNAHGLKYNFAQLEKMKSERKCTCLLIVYGTVADKDVESVFPLLPADAEYFFTSASGKRAMDSGKLLEKYLSFCKAVNRKPCVSHSFPKVEDAVKEAFARAAEIKESSRTALPLIYIGGSTYVVSEAVRPACGTNSYIR